MGLGKPVFTRKNGNQKGGGLYKWSPIPNDKKAKQKGGGRNYYCDARPRSQGEDWKVTYMYTITVDGAGVQHRVAYVECDYVA